MLKLTQTIRPPYMGVYGCEQFLKYFCQERPLVYVRGIYIDYSERVVVKICFKDEESASWVYIDRI